MGRSRVTAVFCYPRKMHLCALRWLVVASLLAGCAHRPGEPPFATKELIHHRFDGEETGAVFGTKVLYFDADERKQFRITVRGGRILDASGKPLNTERDGAIFVMNGAGTFFASESQDAGVFHHSSFVAGGPIAAGGVLHVRDGVLEVLTDKSGHYEPEPALTRQALHRLRALGIDLDAVRVKLETFGELSATECLAGQP